MTALASGMPTISVLVIASVGNILAIIVNYWLGYWLYEKTKLKLNSSKLGAKSLEYGHRYGYYTLALSWLPAIGDPLTLVAGVLRLNFFYFVVIAGGLRVARYYLLTFVL